MKTQLVQIKIYGLSHHEKYYSHVSLMDPFLSVETAAFHNSCPPLNNCSYQSKVESIVTYKNPTTCSTYPLGIETKCKNEQNELSTCSDGT
jgi:hypothetical protein